MRKMAALVVGILVLAVANYVIYSREQLLAQGEVVLLELAPVDPRSLMQGDYMALRFQVANDAFRFGNGETQPLDGTIILTLNEKRVGRFARMGDGAQVAANELRMRYRLREGRPKFATNAYFFQEGTGERYARARYGEFRVAANGDAILTLLRDADFQAL